jgi:hypothetical protein
MCDNLASLRKSELTNFVGSLSASQLRELNRALTVAMGLGSGSPGPRRHPWTPALSSSYETGRSGGCILTDHRPELMSEKKMLPFHGITPHAAAELGM